MHPGARSIAPGFYHATGTDRMSLERILPRLADETGARTQQIAAAVELLEPDGG
jgi:hypothetical protein